MKWNSSSTFQQAPTGIHTAILIKIIDLGTQENEYKGEKKFNRQNLITWELPDELMDDGQPFTISKFYTASLGEKANLTKDLISWLGKAPDAKTFDPSTLLGKPCQVIISGREGSDKVGVTGLAPISKNTQVPKKPHNPLVFFDLDEFDQAVFDGISSGIQNMIMKSPEYAKIVNGEEPDTTPEQDDEPVF